jgi:myo-inositol-1(or 4)-monophosphatase
VGDDRLLAVLGEAAAACRQALDDVDDWGLPGARPGQYRADLVADAAAVPVLLGAGLGVLSEESGLHAPERELLAVLDPLDGSTNAARGIARYATSVCVLDAEGPRAALVVDQASGRRYEAVRGDGAARDGRPVRPSAATALGEAILGLSGHAPRHLGWSQYRALGAIALDLCAVADGTLDGFVDAGADGHGPWDYLGASLVCAEAGALVVDARGRDLVVRSPATRRSPVAAATADLLGEVREALGATAHPGGR